MRYYIYISDSKVDMLLPQVPNQIKRKIADEFAIDLKIFSARRQTEVLDNDTRVSRLQVVEHHLRENASVGSVDDHEARWIADCLPMRWSVAEVQYCGKNHKIVFFAGQKDSSYVVLTGSAENVLGTTHGYSGSLAPTILAVLAREPEWIRKALEVNSIEGAIGAIDMMQLNLAEEQEALGRVVDMAEMRNGAVQEVEFLAKRMMSGQTIRHTYEEPREVSVVLGTPLYVAQAD